MDVWDTHSKFSHSKTKKNQGGPQCLGKVLGNEPRVAEGFGEGVVGTAIVRDKENPQNKKNQKQIWNSVFFPWGAKGNSNGGLLRTPRNLRKTRMRLWAPRGAPRAAREVVGVVWAVRKEFWGPPAGPHNAGIFWPFRGTRGSFPVNGSKAGKEGGGPGLATRNVILAEEKLRVNLWILSAKLLRGTFHTAHGKSKATRLGMKYKLGVDSQSEGEGVRIAHRAGGGRRDPITASARAKRKWSHCGDLLVLGTENANRYVMGRTRWNPFSDDGFDGEQIES